MRPTLENTKKQTKISGHGKAAYGRSETKCGSRSCWLFVQCNYANEREEGANECHQTSEYGNIPRDKTPYNTALLISLSKVSRTIFSLSFNIDNLIAGWANLLRSSFCGAIVSSCPVDNWARMLEGSHVCWYPVRIFSLNDKREQE